MESQSRVFAAIVPAGRELSGNEKEQGLEVRAVSRQSPGKCLREVQVTGTAEVRCQADRASVRVSVGNSKESVSEATHSVSRRLGYILQALSCMQGRNLRVAITDSSPANNLAHPVVKQHDIREDDASVRRFLHRDADMYRMDAEVIVTFSDFEKMERICSILLEKLDKSVSVGTPEFYHSAECLSQMRLRACVSAVENAQLKASKVSQLLGQSLGPPLLVREEETKEWRSNEDNGGGGQGSAAPSHFPSLPTVTASSQVSVSFSLRDTSRKMR